MFIGCVSIYIYALIFFTWAQLVTQLFFTHSSLASIQMF